MSDNLGKGHTLTLQSKQIVLNVIKYLSNLYKDKMETKEMTVKELIIEVAIATGCSKATVERIKSESENNGLTPPKKHTGNPQKYKIEENDRQTFATLLNDKFYSVRKLPNINEAFLAIRFEPKLSFSNCCYQVFRRLIREMDYKLVNVKKLQRKIIMERPDIVNKRREYFVKCAKLREQYPNSAWVWLDETWSLKNETRKKVLCAETPNLGQQSIARGDRFSIIHAMTSTGFVKGALDIKINEEITADSYEQWVKNKLLPNIPPNSVIVADNSPTHTRYDEFPTRNWKVQDIRDFLINKGFDLGNFKIKKDDLLCIVNQWYARIPTFDKIIRENGHHLVRLPPYHCHFNPIEMIWSQYKAIILSELRSHLKNPDFVKLIENIFENIGKDNCQMFVNLVTHCKNLEEDCINSDNIVTQLLNDLNLDNEDSDCDENSSDNEDCDCDNCGDTENR